MFSLQSWTKADDISEFEIEGMSIGDSLLDYFSKSSINSNKKNWYKSKLYSASLFSKRGNLYDQVAVNYKTDDNKYIIKSLAGIKFYKNNINDCYIKMKEIEKSISDVVTNTRKINERTVKHHNDKSGKSTIREILFIFKTNDTILIQCYDWSKERKATDHLRIRFRTKEFQKWLWKAYN